eukprot:TRINITY_DN4206_c0_g1_i1.p3 TRINITY_DN4206_c0_g1~~TRINITY_DN4206_c0_g1_i1.p3  ORF type:complete len:104 (-),score=17.93 TRINITY_DN4206_c0_g1_i1:76-387(-)
MNGTIDTVICDTTNDCATNCTRDTYTSNACFPNQYGGNSLYYCTFSPPPVAPAPVAPAPVAGKAPAAAGTPQATSAPKGSATNNFFSPSLILAFLAMVALAFN